jgi:riboflavin kinase / FMN adenylyltransferase
MKIIHSAPELQTEGKQVCLAIGFFDGVHLGHQQIIRQTIQHAEQHEALPLVITFDQHPNVVVAPDRVPPLIYCLEQKLAAISSLDVDTLLLFHFDRTFSEQPAETFIRSLVNDFGRVQSICVGTNFLFGYQRRGNLELLRKLGNELHFVSYGLAAVALDGKPVSSTRIRETVQSGDLDGASQMLGRAYSLAGRVFKGNGVGRQLGFPTANLNVKGLVLPPTGVYAVHAKVEGKTWRAVANIGVRPTLGNPNPEIQVEAHLLEFDGDLYERFVEIIFVEKMRDEKKFGSLADLRTQIERDIREAQLKF